MATNTRPRRAKPPEDADGELDKPPENKNPPDDAPARSEPDPAAHPTGPVNIQVSPQGQVSITIAQQSQTLRLFEQASMVTPKGFDDLFGFPPKPPPPPVVKPPESGELTPIQKLNNALDTLRGRLADFVEDVTTLEVRTYVSERLDLLEQVAEADREAANGDGEKQGGEKRKDRRAADLFAASEVRAYTRIDLDGDTQIVVPMNAGELDETLWKIHLETVAQAQAHREAMFKTVVELVSGLIPSVK